jgi:hypothetical protein
MGSLRQFMQKNPMMGWVLASLLMIFAAVMLYMRLGAKTETQQLAENVTIRDAETGETWKMPRGAMEKELYLRPFPLDPNKGLLNPKTGKPTGFPADAWKDTVDRINAERTPMTARTNIPSTPPPAPGK